MTITLTPEIESAVTEQARQQGITPEQLALDGLRCLFATPEPSEEEEAWHRVQAQLLLAQIERMTAEMAQDDPDAEARRAEREAERVERAAISEDTRRMLDQLGSRYPPEKDEAREQDLTALRLENQRLCAAAGLEPGWLFGKSGAM